jgi:hypothetical protein
MVEIIRVSLSVISKFQNRRNPRLLVSQEIVLAVREFLRPEHLSPPLSSEDSQNDRPTGLKRLIVVPLGSDFPVKLFFSAMMADVGKLRNTICRLPAPESLYPTSSHFAPQRRKLRFHEKNSERIAIAARPGILT